MAILFALVSYFGWGAGDVLLGLSSRRIGAFLSSFWLYGWGLLISLPLIPIVINSLADVTPITLIMSIVLGIIGATGVLAYVEGLRIGNASIVGTIGGSFGAIVVLLSLIFLNEKLFTNQIIAIILIFIGVIFSSLNLKDLKEKNLLNKGTGFALIAMMAWGIGFTFVKIPIEQFGWFWPSFFGNIAGFLMFALLILRRDKKFFIRGRKNSLLMFIAALVLTIGTLSFNYALSIGQSSIVAPIAGSSITLFVLLSRFAFKDRLTKQQWAGIIITLCGIVLLAIFS